VAGWWFARAVQGRGPISRWEPVMGSTEAYGAEEVAARADFFAAAALRELPEALIVAFDPELCVVITAGHALDRLGAPGARGKGAPLSEAFPQELWSVLEPLFVSALEGETRSREVWTEERRHCLMVDVGPLRLEPSGGEIAGGVAVVLDITARRAGEPEHVLPPGGHFEEVFERAPLGTGLLDSEGRWLLVNRALCDITGYTPEELTGRRFEAIVHPEDAENDLHQRRELLLGRIPAFQVEKRYFDAAGETVSAIVSTSLVRDQAGAPLHYIVQLQDISERKQLEEHLRHLADHDHLTGLRNRRLFDHDLKLQVARSQRYGETAGLIVIDLDAFKAVNDTHGHQAGDDVLRAVARALTRRLRESDLVARLGGDEFAVLLPHVDDTSLAFVAEGLERLIPACAVDVGHTVLHPRASLGWVLIAEQTASAEQALVEADRAMYTAKRTARPAE
jgi:diguanylate cyclase (GGDEF)-like protein/PAS domain S-box-containing protein